jgi:hypothetical protein
MPSNCSMLAGSEGGGGGGGGEAETAPRGAGCDAPPRPAEAFGTLMANSPVWVHTICQT